MSKLKPSYLPHHVPCTPYQFFNLWNLCNLWTIKYFLWNNLSIFHIDVRFPVISFFSVEEDEGSLFFYQYFAPTKQFRSPVSGYCLPFTAFRTPVTASRPSSPRRPSPPGRWNREGNPLPWQLPLFPRLREGPSVSADKGLLPAFCRIFPVHRRSYRF